MTFAPIGTFLKKHLLKKKEKEKKKRISCGYKSCELGSIGSHIVLSVLGLENLVMTSLIFRLLGYDFCTCEISSFFLFWKTNTHKREGNMKYLFGEEKKTRILFALPKKKKLGF